MANNVYQALETAVTWLASGGTELFTPTSLGAAAGRQGAHHDFTTAAVGRRFGWRAWLKPGGTRVVAEFIDIYLKTSDGTRHDNDDGTGDIAVSSSDKLRNLQYLGTIFIDENAAVEMVAHGEIFLPHRYAAPIFWNSTANTLSATAADYGFSMTPCVDQVQ